MKAAWDPVKLRVDGWCALQPVCGDEIRTRTGRRYRILETHYRGERLARVDCIVLPMDADVQGVIFEWRWTPRRKR